MRSDNRLKMNVGTDRLDINEAKTLALGDRGDDTEASKHVFLEERTTAALES